MRKRGTGSGNPLPAWGSLNGHPNPPMAFTTDGSLRRRRKDHTGFTGSRSSGLLSDG
jgi:hypothetical protein